MVLKRPSAHLHPDKTHSTSAKRAKPAFEAGSSPADQTHTPHQAPVAELNPEVIVSPRKTVSEGPQIDIALVDLFAGLRTVHVAARTTRINFVLSAAAEKCPFANRLAKRNKIIETCFEDVRRMDKKWATYFVNDALTLKAKAILVIGVFACEGLSKARGKG